MRKRSVRTKTHVLQKAAKQRGYTKEQKKELSMEGLGRIVKALQLPSDFGKPTWNLDHGGDSFARAEFGEIVMEARVILGGNNWWTPYVIKSRIGRKCKRGPGRIASTVLEHAGRPQTRTRDEAMTWCESVWEQMAVKRLLS